MSSESTHCSNFSSIGSSGRVSVTTNSYLVVGINDLTATIKMPLSATAYVIVLGDNSPTITTESSSNQTLDENGVAWVDEKKYI